MPPRGGHGALLALLLLLLLPAVAAQTGLKEEKAEYERRVDCTVSCTHRSRGPVCGTNGITYRSLCELDLNICRKVRVSLKHEGECTLEEKCLDERRARQEEVASGESVHVPNCLEDGSYAPVQCHNFTHFCWCSSLDGIPIPETVQPNTVPKCPDRTREASRTASPPGAGKSGTESGSGPAREESLNTLLSLSTATPAGRPNKRPRRGPKRCTGRARRTFIGRLSQKMVKEYQRGRNTQRLSERKLLKRALKWKFSELDRTNDRKLQRREYKRLRKMVRKYIKPKKCAKMFPRLCDANGDRSLTEREWLTCFTRQGEKNRQSDGRCTTPPCRNKPTTPKPSVPSCERERSRHGILETEDSSNMSIPVYKCQPNGRYEPMQCFKADNTDVICICVDEWTGNSLDGTGVRNGTPDCSRPMPHARSWPGCAGEVKAKFMQDLKKFLFSKVEGGDRNPGAASSTQSVEEFAARYHFGSLDTNNSSYLEGREKKMVKRHFKSKPKLKRCGRKMTIYCDVNYDKKVSLEEWVACVTVQQNDTGNSAGGVRVRTIDENPLHKYLVAEEGEIYGKSRNQ